jgi:hypothetical protein
MRPNETINIVARIGFFCARHALAVVALTVSTCVLWTVVYLALFFWAIFSGGGIGGPLAYPAGLIFFAIASTFMGIFVFLPTTAFAEWFTHRQGWPILAQIPMCVAGFSLICITIIFAAIYTSAEVTFLNAAMGFLALIVIYLIPLTIYWWVAQSIPLLISLTQRIRAALQSRARIL